MSSTALDAEQRGQSTVNPCAAQNIHEQQPKDVVLSCYYYCCNFVWQQKDEKKMANTKSFFAETMQLRAEKHCIHNFIFSLTLSEYCRRVVANRLRVHGITFDVRTDNYYHTVDAAAACKLFQTEKCSKNTGTKYMAAPAICTDFDATRVPNACNH